VHWELSLSYVVPELAGSLPLIQCHPPARIRVGRGKGGGVGAWAGWTGSHSPESQAAGGF